MTTIERHWTPFSVAEILFCMSTPNVPGDVDTGKEGEPEVAVLSAAPDGSPVVTVADDPSEHCVKCSRALLTPPQRGPFGFGLTRCENCQHRRWYPLSRGVRAFYWVVLGITLLSLLSLLGVGIAALPGAAAVVAAVLLAIDANLRGRHLTANAIGVVMTALIAIGAMLGLFAAGVANGYSFEVVDRPAQQVTEFTAITFESGSQICGGGAAYQACAYMHAAMYNSVCGTSDWSRLTRAARETCGELGDFVDDVLERSRSCGYGCNTVANAEGRWGWSYLRPVAVTTQVTVDRVTHIETCWFNLGPVRLGNCPRD